ncbi:MAG: MATE family efflux transporter [SAR202 cluster bacterium]|nr:MATE family efflux transporter [SAR202 cluster bacterium]
MILSNVTTPLLGIVDTAVVGHLPDPAYLGAVAVGATLFTLLFWGFGFLRMGTGGLTAQAFGARDPGEIRAILGRTLLLGAAIGTALIVLHPLIGRIALPLIGPADDVAESARAYFNIRIWSAPAVLMGYAFLGWTLGVQRAHVTLVISLFTNGLNILLDLLFVLGFGWGIHGVAAGTVIAEWAAAAFGIFIVLRLARSEFPGRWERARILDRSALRRLFSVNRDIFIRTLCLIGAWLWVTNRGAQIGTVALASNALLFQFQAFMAFGLDGFAHASETLVGEAKGAGDRAALRTAVTITTAAAAACAALYSVVYFSAGDVMVRLLTNIPELRAEAGRYLAWVAISPLISVWSFQLDGIFIGATRTAAMRNGMAVSLAIFVALTLALVPAFGNHGLWLSYVVFMAARGVTLGVRYPALEKAVERHVPSA